MCIERLDIHIRYLIGMSSLPFTIKYKIIDSFVWLVIYFNILIFLVCTLHL